MKAKLDALVEADDRTALVRTEMEEESRIVNKEITKIYKSEKEKLQETIEELELELKVCVQTNLQHI